MGWGGGLGEGDVVVVANQRAAVVADLAASLPGVSTEQVPVGV